MSTKHILISTYRTLLRIGRLVMLSTQDASSSTGILFSGTEGTGLGELDVLKTIFSESPWIDVFFVLCNYKVRKESYYGFKFYYSESLPHDLVESLLMKMFYHPGVLSSH